MAKDSVADWDSTADNNTDVGGISIAGTAPPSNIDNGMREIMAQVADWTSWDTIASGTTTDLSAVDGMYVTISGTATITSFGTLKAGILKFLRFSGAGQITHNATSMILPGGVNITRAAGDAAIFVSEGSGNWRCLSASSVLASPTLILKQSSNPTPTAEGDMQWDTDDNAIIVGDGSSRKIFRASNEELIRSGSQSDVLTTTFTDLGAYRNLRIVGRYVGGGGTSRLTLQVSSDNGSTWLNSASAYAYQVTVASGTTINTAAGAETTLRVSAADSLGSAFETRITNFGLIGSIYFKTISADLRAGSVLADFSASGFVSGGPAMNALRFLYSSGNNISNCDYDIYGVRA